MDEEVERAPRRRGRLAGLESAEAEIARTLRRGRQNAANKKKREKIAFLSALPEAEVKKRLTLTEEDFDTLQQIIRAPQRNAIAQLAAIRLKAQFTVAQPKQEIGGEIGIQVIVNSLKRKDEPYELPAASSTATLAGVVASADGEEGQE